MPDSIRLSGAVIFVTDLRASEDFYRDLLELDVEVASAEAVLLTGVAGDHLVLRALPGAGHPTAGVGVQYLVWTARDAEDLDRCESILRAREAFVSATSNQGVKVVEGRDPDFVPVIVVYPADPVAGVTALPTRIYTY